MLRLTPELFDPLANPLPWDAFALSHPCGSVFHMSAWALVLRDSYHFPLRYLVLREGPSIAAALPIMETRTFAGRRRGVSLPFSDFCEPLCSAQEQFDALFAQAMAIAGSRNWKSLEIRGGQQFLAARPAVSWCYTHTINLDRDDATLLRAMRDSTRRNIRKALGCPVEVRHETTLEATRHFYYLNCLTRRDHGLPPQPWSFFRHCHAHLFATGKGFVTIVYHQGRPAAADVYLIAGSKAFYKYGAADKRLQNLRPSNLAMWEGIRECRARGATSLNLGRTEPQHEGLLQFKRGLGATETKSYYRRIDTASARFHEPEPMHHDRCVNAVMRRMPLPLLKLAGFLLYRYQG